MIVFTPTFNTKQSIIASQIINTKAMKENSIRRTLGILLSAVLFLCSGLASSAQTRSISGTVKDAIGPVIGASVTVPGYSKLGATTDIDGKFSLNVPEGASISVSCIGYQTQVIPVGNRTSFDITLIEDTEFLEETVVIGYGVQKKSDITGSIASVKASDLKDRTSANAMQAIQGKAAGVVIQNSSAKPGSGSDIRVRGISSNSSDGLGPLLIVDGLQVDNIQYLDPSMIESMEILKDAASAAIYGAQAGNGVVLITTKAGSTAKGEGHFFYNYQFASSSLQKAAEVMNAEQYIGWGRATGRLTDAILENAGYDGKTDTDWVDAVFGNGMTQKHTLGFQGSTDRSNFYVAITNLNEDGIVRGDKDFYKRLSAQINADFKINNWLTVGTNTSLEKWSSQSIGEHSRYSGSVLLGTLIMDPLTPVYYENPDDLSPDLKAAIAQGKNVMKNADGKYYAVSKIQESDAGNPLIHRDRNNALSDGIAVRGTLFANISPIKGLVFTSRFGYRITQQYSTDYRDPYYASGRCNATIYELSENSTTGYYYQWENFANYNLNLGKHNITVMAGMSFIENLSRRLGATISGTDPLTGYAENFRYLGFANSSATKTLNGGIPSQSASLSYFGRLSWNYDNRYNLQANFRADAFDSSKLSSSNRWGYFPSFSAGWTISNENFFKDNIGRDAVSFLKIRASWGQNGNIAVLKDYAYSTSISYNSQKYQWDVNDNKASFGSRPSGLANPDLKWEVSEQYDLGLDARFLDNRLTFAADYYNKMTNGLLVTVTNVAEVGIATSTINAGNVHNSGFEFELGWKDNIGDFSYSVNANLSTLKNEVTYLDPSVSRILGTDIDQFATYFEAGYPVWYMRGYQYEGVDANTGDPIYKDINGDGSTNSEDLTMIGCGIPKLNYGITLNLSYKNLDLTVFGHGVGGNQIFPSIYRTDRPLVNCLSYFYENAWSESNRNASMPNPAAIATSQVFWASSANVFDGSYFKIKQIQLGYSLPSKLVRKAGISSLRVYASLDDFFTFTKYPGFDPETASNGTVSTIGVDEGSYPTAKKLVFGINLQF